MHEKMRKAHTNVNGKPERKQRLWIAILRWEDYKVDFIELRCEGME